MMQSLGETMGALLRYKWKFTAALLVVVALVVDLVAKQFAATAMTSIARGDRHPPYALASDRIAFVGLGVVCIGGLFWVVSLHRHEGGSHAPLFVLLSVYLLSALMAV